MLQSRRTRIAALAASAAMLVGAASAGVAGATTAKSSKQDLSGVTLNVGTIGGLGSVLLKAAGQASGIPYKVNFSSFQDGPSTVAAIQGGSVDLGQTADTPAIFALAAGDALKVAGVLLPVQPGAPFSIVVGKNSGITSLKQLKGKTIAVASGTAMQYLALAALNKYAGGWKNATLANLTPVASLSALSGGSVQAAVLSQPYVDLALAGGAKQLATGKGIVNGYAFYLASNSALANPGKAAAIADYFTRLAKSEVWASKHLAAAAQAIHTALPTIPVGIAQVLIANNLASFVKVGPAVYKATQAEAALFHQVGLLNSSLNVQPVFTTTYNALVGTLPKA